MPIKTIQIRLMKQQIKSIDSLIRNGVFPSRSEAVRNMVSSQLIILCGKGLFLGEIKLLGETYAIKFCKK